jgi:hypothetical protein
MTTNRLKLKVVPVGSHVDATAYATEDTPNRKQSHYEPQMESSTAATKQAAVVPQRNLKSLSAQLDVSYV